MDPRRHGTDDDDAHGRARAADPSEAGPPPHPARRFAFFAGCAGALVAAAVTAKGILASASPTAAVGFVFLPFIAIAVAVLAGVWGLALGTVVTHHRGVRGALRPVLVMAWVVSVAAPAALAWEIAAGFALAREVRGLAAQDAGALDAALERSRFRGNRFFLGALAQHPAASPQLLERIASLTDPGLREPMGSLWDVMGENRAGVPVAHLVARHPHTPAGALLRLAEGADDALLEELLKNPNAPRGIGRAPAARPPG